MDSAVVIPAVDSRVAGLRARQQEFAARFDLTLDQYLKIVKTCNTVEAITVLELLKAHKHRSLYRERRAIKVRLWLCLLYTSPSPRDRS